MDLPSQQRKERGLSRLRALAEYLGNNQHILAPGLIIAVLVMFLLPVPVFVLDLMFTASFSISLMILLTVMYMPKPTAFSSFPSVLLLTALVRLSLNVASTRIILLHGHEGTDAAGKVIRAFGQFVVGGEFIVGLIVFSVIIIIQFVVINVGSSRIAEVTARFTLDALPGKQMSIDADLNSGLIEESEAKKRRKDLQEEADFYGAMDGAIKFVAKDAIASMLIVGINILGGLSFGIFRHGMAVREAAETFIILTIGDGLVSAMPSLFISIAAGMLTTRATARDSLGQDIISQVFADRKPVAFASGSLLLFGLVPGLPTVPFWSLGLLLAAMAYYASQNAASEPAAAGIPSGAKPGEALPEGASQPALPPPAEQVEKLLKVDPMGLEVGYGLIALVDARKGGNILDRIKAIRRQIALEMGLVVPPIRIRDNLQLRPNQYHILLKGVPVAEGELLMGHLLAMNPGTATGDIEGVLTREPAFGLEAYWIQETQKDAAQGMGYTVVDLSTVITTHLSETIKRHAKELLGRQETQRLIDNLAETHPKIVEDLIPHIVPLGTVQQVLKNLIAERVSIRDLLTILETLAEYGHAVKDPGALTEGVRAELARAIAQPYLNERGELATMVFKPETEQQLHDYLQHNESGSFFAMGPSTAQRLLDGIKHAIENSAFAIQPILLVSADLRLPLRRLLERVLPNLVVLSHNEIPSNVSVVTVGVVGM